MFCAQCGKGIGQAARRVNTSVGPVCGRCVDGGVLLRRLDCGHMSTAGSTVVRHGAGFSCWQCSKDYFQMKEKR